MYQKKNKKTTITTENIKTVKKNYFYIEEKVSKDTFSYLPLDKIKTGSSSLN